MNEPIAQGVEEHTAQLAERLMRYLSARGWRRARYDLVTRLATLVDAERVVYVDAQLSGHDLDYSGRIVLFTESRLFVQTVTHTRGQERASVDIRVIRRSALQSLTTAAVEDASLPPLDRLCDAVAAWSAWLGEVCERFCAWLTWTFPSLAHLYGQPEPDEPEDLHVDLTFGGLDGVLRLPLAGDDGTRGRFERFLPSLTSNLS